jgi:hypothetical protein
MKGHNAIKIPLTKGKLALIDKINYPLVSKYKWFTHGNRYAATYINNKLFLMHRLLLKATKGMIVDHINSDGFDNRKNNLRICTQSQNLANRNKQNNNTSGYKGVYWQKSVKKWSAHIMVNQKYINLGTYVNILDAVKAYNYAAKEYFGEYARINK